MLVPGIVSFTFKSFSSEEILKITSSCGLKAIEWSENYHIECGNTGEAREVARRTRELGLEVAAYSSYYRLGKGMDIRPSLDNALAMEAPIVRVWAGSQPSGELSEQERSALTEELRRAVGFAREAGIPLGLEWHKNTLTDENASGLRLIKEIDSPYLRTFWQQTKALSIDERAEGLKAIMPYLENLHVYWWDESGRRPLREGREIWKTRYLPLMDNRKHYVLIENIMNDSVEQFREDAAELISWID